MASIIRINSSVPLNEQVTPAVEVLAVGGIIAYPTETFYGLGADALNPRAVRKIFAAKQRDESQPLLILIPDRSHLSRYARMISPIAEKLIDRFWPGPLTLIFSAQPNLPPELCAYTGTVAVRVSPHPVARAVVEAFGSAITSTSANLSGQPSPTTANDVLQQLAENIDLIIDAGRTAGGKPSTIVDVTSSSPRLVREGAVSVTEICACN